MLFGGFYVCSRRFFLADVRALRHGLPIGQPTLLFRLPGGQRSRSASPLNDALTGTTGDFPAERLSIRLLGGESERVIVRVSWFSRGIYEVPRTLDTPPAAQFTSVETVSPPWRRIAGWKVATGDGKVKLDNGHTRTVCQTEAARDGARGFDERERPLGRRARERR